MNTEGELPMSFLAKHPLLGPTAAEQQDAEWRMRRLWQQRRNAAAAQRATARMLMEDGTPEEQEMYARIAAVANATVAEYDEYLTRTPT